MNMDHHQKTLSYIVLGIVVVIALAAYIYITLSHMPTVSENTQPTTGQTGLTPAQAAAKQALITQQLAMQKPEPLTKKQATAKTALLQAQLKAQSPQ